MLLWLYSIIFILLLNIIINISIVYSLLLTLGFTILSIYIKLIVAYEKRKINRYYSLEQDFHTIVSANIYHEVSSPLFVLDNLVYNIEDNNKQKMAIQSLIQIKSTLESTRIIKENKNIEKIDMYSLIQTAFDSLLISKKFTYSINKNLKKLYVTHWKSGILINVMFNIVKNSIEAGADRIDVDLLKTGKNISLLFTDNGFGIVNGKGDLLKNTNKIFEYGYSTKQLNNKIKSLTIIEHIKMLFSGSVHKRGVGLYLMRKLLQNNGSNLGVLETSKKGTTFQITLNNKLLEFIE